MTIGEFWAWNLEVDKSLNLWVNHPAMLSSADKYIVSKNHISKDYQVIGNIRGLQS